MGGKCENKGSWRKLIGNKEATERKEKERGICKEEMKRKEVAVRKWEEK